MDQQLKTLTVVFVLVLIIAGVYNYYNYLNLPEDTDNEDNSDKDNDNSTATENVTTYSYSIINSYPHDSSAFTQGLVYEDNVLYEGTGLRGSSSLRKVELDTGKVLQIRNLSSELFGEGVTIFQDNIIQLTWRSNIGFVYDKSSFELLGEFNYSTEGWGLTHDNNRLIMSDGTDELYFLDPETYEKTGKIQITDNGTPVVKLNELEYINGKIYANVWQTDRIAIISPETGEILSWIELNGLLSAEEVETAGVLNGIAYDSENQRLFVTGKLWPKIFEIELIPKN
jgi:glutamine cyclotransferase